MRIYKKKGSPFWWYDIPERYGRPRIRKSTEVYHSPPTSDLRKQNLAQAETVMHRKYTELTQGALSGDRALEAITFSAFAQWYLTHISPHKRGTSAERYVLWALAKRFGKAPLASITKQRYQEWITERRKDVKASTVNRQVDVLKHLLAAAVPKYLNASPLAGLARLRQMPSDSAVLSRQDESRLLKALTPAERALIIAAIDALIREGDLLKLTWADDHGTFLSVNDPKEDNPYKARVSKRLRAALNTIKPNPAHGRIFPDWDHKDEVLRMLKRACKAAGVTYGRAHGGVTFHRLRHTGATRMMEQGTPARIIMAAGAWKDIRSVARYTHPSEAELEKAVNQVGKGVKMPVPSSVPEPSHRTTHPHRKSHQHR